MIHGWILNGIKFGLDAAIYYPNGASESEIKTLAHWLSVNPNGTFEQWKEAKSEEGRRN
jgi:hypothetical protein